PRTQGATSPAALPASTVPNARTVAQGMSRTPAPSTAQVRLAVAVGRSSVPGGGPPVAEGSVPVVFVLNAAPPRGSGGRPRPVVRGCPACAPALLAGPPPGRPAPAVQDCWR